MNAVNVKGVYLLPKSFRPVGWLFVFLGIVFAVFRFHYGMKPEFLEIKVFAVYSSFLQTKYFTFITNNYSEEVVGLLLFIGLLFIAFSKEKDENEEVMLLRLRSLFLSVYINSVILILSLLFVFGLGFVKVLVLNMFSVFVIYIIVFRYSLSKLNRSSDVFIDLQ